MPGTLAGKTAIITGAGTGVGRALARRFSEAGARLMLADEDDAALAETLDVCEGEADKFHGDMQERLSVNNLLAATQDRYRSLDILVSAGRQARPGSFMELSPEDFAAAQAENVQSVFMLAQAVARRMIERREKEREFSGAMVMMSSIASQRTVPELFSYSVACAALDQLTRSIAANLAEHRIRVNGVALGSLMTRNLRAALKERPELREEMVRVTPLGRIGEVDEAAQAALFLASPQASFITGQILPVDGGRLVLDPLASPER
jgi:7-alpha-hydroxysteroid dehydrogenase